MEMYLNTITLGQGCYGVQTAAQLYFGKDVSDLTLAECACIISITNNPDTELGRSATINICADTGPEVITGSTRMKAGTAQKIIMNMISTTSMVKCGHVHENLMINLKPSNKKLRRRVIRIVEEILHCDEQKAEELLEQHNWSIRAVVDANV